MNIKYFGVFILFLMVGCSSSKPKEEPSYEELAAVMEGKSNGHCDMTRVFEGDGTCVSINMASNGKSKKSEFSRVSCIGLENEDAPKELRGKCASKIEVGDKIVKQEGDPAIFEWLEKKSK